MTPEMSEVAAHRRRRGINQVLGEIELVKGLIPEFALRFRLQHAPTRARHRRREHHRPHQFGVIVRQGLRDPAADVVTTDHDRTEAELTNEPGHAPGLLGSPVVRAGVHVVLVRVPKTSQVGRHHPGVLDKLGHEGRVVAAVSGPAVEQHNRRTGSDVVIGQTKPVHWLARLRLHVSGLSKIRFTVMCEALTIAGP